MDSRGMGRGVRVSLPRSLARVLDSKAQDDIAFVIQYIRFRLLQPTLLRMDTKDS